MWGRLRPFFLPPMAGNLSRVGLSPAAWLKFLGLSTLLDMGKTRPPERSKLDRRKKKLLADKKRKSRPSYTPAELLAQASLLLQQSDVDAALDVATNALRQLKASIVSDEDVINCLPAFNLLGEINVE